jgi:hypothetical protein
MKFYSLLHLRRALPVRRGMPRLRVRGPWFRDAMQAPANFVSVRRDPYVTETGGRSARKKTLQQPGRAVAVAPGEGDGAARVARQPAGRQRA